MARAFVGAPVRSTRELALHCGCCGRMTCDGVANAPDSGLCARRRASAASG
eukprot:CAMPEP_0171120758 /NCGR_PEP_ID=MMETSP0766_2-20121228/100547_1 /TAXON_ID=439317 /ORGANISM="Gambierdiscus australes, Strain CAWD 149" /LENGTH=50 /DNA_ID=CAMNT_0011583507 /DNA_START=71 /DNA_END=220 /DNA_ORIENTATION=+